jgi:hypothetical protein
MARPEQKVAFRPRRKRANLEGPQRKVFHGVGVVITQIRSDTLFSVTGILTDEQFVDFSNMDLWFSVDMTRTPRRAGKTDWVKVLIDDRGIDKFDNELLPDVFPMTYPLAITSIGTGSTDDPARGAFVGAVYLERDYYLSLHGTKVPGWPGYPGDYKLVQLTSIAYSESTSNGDRRGKRYHGFWATVTAVVDNKVTVEITEKLGTHMVTFTAGNTAAYDTDPPDEALDGQKSLAENLEIGQSGALFIELKTAVGAQLDGPKLPIGFEG